MMPRASARATQSGSRKMMPSMLKYICDFVSVWRRYGRQAATHYALAEKFDRDVLPVERQFVYLPPERSESASEQKRCLALMREKSIYPETQSLHEWNEKHRVIIERCGRFPLRNAALGLERTTAELEFQHDLAQGFSSSFLVRLCLR
jgi:uncharacterized protein (DUF924 family)